MIRGTTPTHRFNIPIDTSLIKKCRVTYAQYHTKLFSKNTDDCTFVDGAVKVKLSQEETLLFTYGSLAQVQLKILTTEGDILLTPVMNINVDPAIDDEVLE